MQDINAVSQESLTKAGWHGLSSSTVKLVGITTMFIDHFAAALLARILLTSEAPSELLYYVYVVMREIGRLGFPIFCFLLVEGFDKTRSKAKYALRLGLFALISEVPFDLAFSAKALEFHNQNVYFTLFLGLLALCCYECLRRRGLPRAITLGLDLAVLAAFMLAAEFLHTDYAGMGVLTITVMYAFRSSKAGAMAGGCLVLTLMSLNELPAFFAVLPAAGYNGKRGWRLKYFFYVFYPAHLFLLWFVAELMGMGSKPVI